MHFLIVAKDGVDDDAPARRQRAREGHVALVRKLKELGNFTLGGHTLDADERIVGSAVIVEFPSRTEPDAYLASEPYAVHGVWQDVQVTRINLG
jgi:uncharacterized protein YciI